MAESWKWPGARWWKCDLHLHTPASYDFAGRENVTPEQWVEAARSKGLEALAVTDHETSAWVEEIGRAASGGEPLLAVFPGVEITSREGAHLIVLFEPGTLRGHIDDLLAQCGIGVEMRGKSGAIASLGFLECLECAAGKDALAVAAHADRAAGEGKRETSLLHVVRPGNPLNQVLGSPLLRAAEVWEGSQEGRAQLQRPRDKTDLPPLGILSSSDAHRLDQIGDRFTWIKMTRPDLEGLRLAIEDGSLSLRRSAETGQDPNRHAPLAIESIVVTDGRYMGRGRPFTVELNPWLNAIIGGRGTGKSSLVELLRIALRREDELPEKLKEDLDRLKKLDARREEPGILREDTSIEVIYRKDGQRFRIRWDPRGTSSPIAKQGAEGIWQEEGGRVSERFPARIFSQKQIFELAGQPEALLGVVDDAPQVDRRGWQEDWRQEEARFLALRAKGREIETHLEEEGGLHAELADLERKLEVFDSSDYREILTAYQQRQRQRRALEDWMSGVEALGARLRQMTAGWRPLPLASESFDSSDLADRQVLEAALATERQLDVLAENLEGLSATADAVGAPWTEGSALDPWRAASDRAEGAFRALEGQLQSQGLGDSSEYSRLVQRRAHLEKRLSGLAGERSALLDIERQTEESLHRLVHLRNELTGRRSRFLEEILGSNRYVRMVVLPFGQRLRAEQELRKILGSDKFSKDFENLLAALYPRSDGSLDGVEERLLDLKTALRVGGMGAGMAFEDARFGALLRALPPEAFDRLDAWFPEDSLEVSYSPGGDGRNFRSLGQGSPGQKAAALLAFFLSYGNEPLILDQPEDDLDNQLITELIVRQLRENKQRRQMLVVTHNPNIVVNGDAELVLVFTSSGGQTHVAGQGGLQETEVRNAVCDVMEGGREAFLLRYRRLGRSTARV